MHEIETKREQKMKPTNFTHLAIDRETHRKLKVNATKRGMKIYTYAKQIIDKGMSTCNKELSGKYQK